MGPNICNNVYNYHDYTVIQYIVDHVAHAHSPGLVLMYANVNIVMWNCKLQIAC